MTCRAHQGDNSGGAGAQVKAWKDKSKHEKAKQGKAAEPEPTKASTRALDIGAGLGYPTSAFYHLVRDGRGHDGGGNSNDAQQRQSPGTGTGASVVAIEHIPALTALTQRNICADRLGDALDLQGIVLVRPTQCILPPL